MSSETLPLAETKDRVLVGALVPRLPASASVPDRDSDWAYIGGQLLCPPGPPAGHTGS